MRKWKKAEKWWKLFWKGFAMYLAVAGLVTFSLFILEESFQTMMFGTWPAQDAERWDIVHEATGKMEAVQSTLSFVNKAFGWIQPFAFVSYGAYVDAEKIYLKGLNAKVLANKPSVFAGETVEIEFEAESREFDTGKVIHRSPGLQVWADTETIPKVIKGKIQVVDSNAVIDIRKGVNSETGKHN